VTKKADAIVPVACNKHSKLMKGKRAVLGDVATKLRRIIGDPTMRKQTASRLVA
jgi:hypothetical protein